jgi:CheY-like chemotaxis protein
MFSQVEGSLSRSQGGLGIGLCLVKSLVELHGGTIEARSDGPGRGSEFVVRLPLAAEAPEPPTDGQPEGTPAGRSSLRILVVDDNRDAANSLAMMLRVLGNEVRIAYDGEEAVRAASDFGPALVLLDVGLPKLNGYEAGRRIRDLLMGSEVFLVAVTGWGQEEDRRRSREAGFDRHLVKPVDPQILKKLLEELEAVQA